MSEHHQGPRYGSIWWWLLGLTIIEVVAATQMPSGTGKLVILVVLAVCKAALVALYFMHLRFERVALLVIAVIPFLICGYFIFMLMPDSGVIERTSEIRAEKVESGKH